MSIPIPLLAAAAGAAIVGVGLARRRGSASSDAGIKTKPAAKLFGSPELAKMVAAKFRATPGQIIQSAGKKVVQALIPPYLTAPEIVNLPLPELAAIVYAARYNTPLDGEDNRGAKAIEDAANGVVGGQQRPYREVQQWLMDRLFDAIKIGLAGRMLTTSAKSGPPHNAHDSAFDVRSYVPDTNLSFTVEELVRFYLAYEFSASSPAGVSDQARALRLVALIQAMIAFPGCLADNALSWFGESYAEQRATRGTFNVQKLYAGLGWTTGCHTLQATRMLMLNSTIDDWKAATGTDAITKASRPALRLLIVELGVIFTLIAEDKPVQWMAGYPSKPSIDWGWVFLSMASLFISAATFQYEAFVQKAVKISRQEPTMSIREASEFAIAEGLAEADISLGI